MKLIELLEKSNAGNMLDIVKDRKYCDRRNRIINKENFIYLYLDFVKEIKDLKPITSDKKLYIEIMRKEVKNGYYTYFILGKETQTEIPFEAMFTLFNETWQEWLGFEILEKSIKQYGVDTIACCIFLNMTYYGMTNKENSKYIRLYFQEEKERLTVKQLSN